MRGSTTQLKLLLTNLEEILAGLDHPLSKLFAELLKNALLDYRDLIATAAVYEWQVDNAEHFKQQLIDQVIEVGRDQIKDQAALRRNIISVVDAAFATPNYSVLRERALAPLTGKEK